MKWVPSEEYLRQCMPSSLRSGQSTEPSQNMCMGKHSPSLHLAVFHWHKLPFSPVKHQNSHLNTLNILF